MSAKQEFVHLHLHTEYSLLDGMCRIGPLIESVVARGMGAVAMTDHMSFFGVVPFVKEAQARGVAPVIGCELDVEGHHRAAGVRAPGDSEDKAPKKTRDNPWPFHILLLAETTEGYSNLLTLVTKALTRTDALRGRVTTDELSSLKKGLIALSGCPRCEIASVFARKGPKLASRLVGAYKELFGDGNWFLEISRHGVEGEGAFNEFLVAQSAAQQVPLVATNDVHYIDPADARAHEILLAIQAATHVDDPKRTCLGSDNFYLRTPEEMYELFRDMPHAVRLSAELARRCQVKLPFGAVHLPGFDISPGHTARSYLRIKCEQGLKERFPVETHAGARERLDRELAVIADKGLSGYFLIVWDLVRYARSQGFPVGPGRGSAVGSLVSYCLGITDVDPMKFNLTFERFLTRERSGLPDIDIDLCHKCRDKIVEYLIHKYGDDHVAHIATLDTLGARSAIRDAGRALAVSDEVIDRVATAIPAGFSDSIENALRDMPQLARMYDTDERAKRLLDTARSIQGLPRHPSVHAGGILVTDAPLTRHVALQRLHSGEVIAQITKDPIEELGLLKIDLLGLRYLTALYDAAALARAHSGVRLEVAGIPLDDAETYALMAGGNTIGVFQLESAGMQDLLRDLKPDRFEDIVAVLSLYRPGPLGGGLVKRYVDRRHGREPIAYPHPMLEPVLRETYGIVLYQEQVMDVARVMADFSMEEADELRVAISRRRPGDLASMRQRFVTGAMSRGVEGEAADGIFHLLLQFGGFGYNKSHSVAYALTTCRCAYMMAHFPAEYVTALLNNNLGFIDRMRNYMAVAREKGVEFLPCDVNRSDVDFTVENGAIRVGLAIVKQVGEALAGEITSERKNRGEFRSLSDFCSRMHGKMGRPPVENLTKVGALDFTGLKRSQMVAVLGQVLRAVTAEPSGEGAGYEEQIDIGLTDTRPGEWVEVPEMDEFPDEQLRSMELEVTDLFISEHPLHDRQSLLKQMGIVTVEQAVRASHGQTVSVAGLLAEYRRIRTKTARPMAFLTLRDETGVIEVVIFPSVFERLARGDGVKGKTLSINLTRDEPLVVSGKIEVKENTKLICENLESLDAAEERFYSAGMLEIRLPSGFKNFSKLKNVLLSAPGKSEVRIEWTQKGFAFAEDTEAEIESLKRHRVQLGEELMLEVEKIVGKGSAKIALAGQGREVKGGRDAHAPETNYAGTEGRKEEVG